MTSEELKERKSKIDTLEDVPIMVRDVAKCLLYELFCETSRLVKPYVYAIDCENIRFDWDFFAADKKVCAVEFDVSVEKGQPVYGWLLCPDEDNSDTWTEAEGVTGNPMDLEVLQKVIEWSDIYE